MQCNITMLDFRHTFHYDNQCVVNTSQIKNRFLDINKWDNEDSTCISAIYGSTDLYWNWSSVTSHARQPQMSMLILHSKPVGCIILYWISSAYGQCLCVYLLFSRYCNVSVFCTTFCYSKHAKQKLFAKCLISFIWLYM